MKLMDYHYNRKEAFEEKGYELPKYDRDFVTTLTTNHPRWIHFGAGNIFRAFPAAVLDKMLNAGDYDHGVIVAEGFDMEIIDKVYQPYENLSLLVVLKADGSIEKRVIGSVVESIPASPQKERDWYRLKEIFAFSFLQMVSFTITEKGYSVTDKDGNPLSYVKEDLQKNGLTPNNTMGKICALLYERYLCGAAPIALVSMDNCSHNGDKLKAAIMYYAEYWYKHGRVEKGFIDYLTDERKVSFPWSMIDKITPRPDETVREMLSGDGFSDTNLIVTDCNTYTAPFVNAEETEYLVIEDSFPNGRPPLEKGGILFTSREVVDQVEKMKVCTCLNPLHTALAIYGCLLNYHLISEEMKDDTLRTLITRMAKEEAMPVVVNPGIIKPEDFLEAVLNQRLPNPFMPDAPQRIATDTSQKLPIRFGETIKAYLSGKFADESYKNMENQPKVSDLTFLPLVLAGYARYLMGVDDEGVAFEPSSDPRLTELMAVMAGVKLGQSEVPHKALETIFRDKTIFATDLYEAGLGEKLEGFFMELIAGKGAVRKTLEKYVNQ